MLIFCAHAIDRNCLSSIMADKWIGFPKKMLQNPTRDQLFVQQFLRDELQIISSQEKEKKITWNKKREKNYILENCGGSFLQI